METKPNNPFAWVEIYVDNMSRAQKFYEEVLQIKMTPMETPGGFGDLEMLCFPFSEEGYGISGALCKTNDMKPGGGGTLVYFGCEDCAIEISRVEQAGGQVIQNKMSIGEHGFCGVCIDIEGNTIGFYSMK